jgi:hypothetical protein
VLEGELAQRMQTNAAAAADKLIAKYRWALFSATTDASESVEQMSTDAMTWDSLIHTTYFEQTEIAEMIATYIAERAANRS